MCQVGGAVMACCGEVCVGPPQSSLSGVCAGGQEDYFWLGGTIVGLIVLPLQCILFKIRACMISLKSGGGGATSTRCPPASYPPGI